MKKILMSLVLLSLVWTVLVEAETSSLSSTSSSLILGPAGNSCFENTQCESGRCLFDLSEIGTGVCAERPNPSCSGEGECIYDMSSKGPTSCCAGLVLEPCEGICTPSIPGKCVKKCTGIENNGNCYHSSFVVEEGDTLYTEKEVIKVRNIIGSRCFEQIFQTICTDVVEQINLVINYRCTENICPTLEYEKEISLLRNEETKLEFTNLILKLKNTNANGELPFATIEIAKETCAGEGKDVYINDSNGPTTCCSGLILAPMVGSSIKNGRCISETIECPHYMPPLDGWCKDGTIVPQPKDENGCAQSAECVKSTTTCKIGCVCNGDTTTCSTEQGISQGSRNSFDKQARNFFKKAKKGSDYQKFTGQLRDKKQFKDVHKIENLDAVEFLQRRGILDGYDNGSFGPKDPINRAESLKVLLESLGEGPDENTTNDFNDVPDNAWFAGYVKKAKRKGIVRGYEDGTFRPGQTVNQVELLKLAFETFGIDLQNYEITNLPETADEEAWYAPYLQYALDNDLLDEEIVAPANGMTREKFSELMYRLIQQQEGL